MPRLSEVLRSLLFYLVFYLGSVFVVSNAVAMLFIGSEATFRTAGAF